MGHSEDNSSSSFCQTRTLNVVSMSNIFLFTIFHTLTFFIFSMTALLHLGVHMYVCFQL